MTDHEQPRAVVLLSGGLDSATALAEAGSALASIGSGAVLVTGSVVTVGEARALLVRSRPSAAGEPSAGG